MAPLGICILPSIKFLSFPVSTQQMWWHLFWDCFSGIFHVTLETRTVVVPETDKLSGILLFFNPTGNRRIYSRTPAGPLLWDWFSGIFHVCNIHSSLIQPQFVISFSAKSIFAISSNTSLYIRSKFWNVLLQHSTCFQSGLIPLPWLLANC